jgi:rhodanese-related sulfurtransferase
MVEEIDVLELSRWQAGKQNFILLDVRDDDEYATAFIPGSTHIPWRELPESLTQLSHDAKIVVMCHHGGRSMRAAMFLQTQGFRYFYNLEGGIDAYAVQIDPTVARY